MIKILLKKSIVLSRKILSNIHFIALVLALFTIACYLLSGLILREGFWHDAFLHMATELTILVVASFLLEPYLSSYHAKLKEKEWKGGKEAALLDLTRLSTSLVSFMYSPMGISFLPPDFHHRPDTFEQHFRLYTFETAKTMSRTKISAAMKTMTKDQWVHMNMNLILLQKDLDEDVLVYKDILPKQILNNLLLFRSIFKNFYYNFGLMSVSYLGKTDKWPRDYPNNQKDNIYLDWYIGNLSELLEKYFTHVLNLYDSLKKLT